MTRADYPDPPSGMPPPDAARLPDGTELELASVARRACEAFVAENPGYGERYGPPGVQWCIHDDQHILNWAVLSLDGSLDLERELGWLARVLDARSFPIEWLARGVELLATAVREAHPGLPELAERLDHGAAFVRDRRFLR